MNNSFQKEKKKQNLKSVNRKEREKTNAWWALRFVVRWLFPFLFSFARIWIFISQFHIILSHTLQRLIGIMIWLGEGWKGNTGSTLLK